MKSKRINLIVFVLFLFPLISLAQINQKDGQGQRHGMWKVNFENSDNPKFEGNYEHGN